MTRSARSPRTRSTCFLFELAKTGVWNAKIKGLWANAPVQANDLTAAYWEE